MDLKEFTKVYGYRELERVAEAAGSNLGYARQILHGHRRPGPALAKSLEKASGGRLSRQQLRPDIWGDAA